MREKDEREKEGMRERLHRKHHLSKAPLNEHMEKEVYTDIQDQCINHSTTFLVCHKPFALKHNVT